MIREDIKEKLRHWAVQYETEEFLKDDPAMFIHRYIQITDVEIIGLIASSLAFGQRSQILLKLERICVLMQESPTNWILQNKYKEFFNESHNKFYRFISYKQMCCFFDAIRALILDYGTIGNYLYKQYREGINPLNAFCEYFKYFDVGNLVPKNTSSCCKRLNMYFRWMVRDNSPVDVGLWKWYDKRLLILPVDTHVMQQAIRLGFIEKREYTLKYAVGITNIMRCIWPEDPCRGDFALFGSDIHHT